MTIKGHFFPLKNLCCWCSLGGAIVEAVHNIALTTYDLSLIMRKPTWSDTNQAVQLQKMARGLKFRTWKVEGLYYLCSQNKGADQLPGHREADLRLFWHMQNVGFLMMWLIC